MRKKYLRQIHSGMGGNTRGPWAHFKAENPKSAVMIGLDLQKLGGAKIFNVYVAENEIWNLHKDKKDRPHCVHIFTVKIGDKA